MAEEKLFENRIKQYVRLRGGKPYKTQGNAFTEVGVPDLLICIKGRFLAVEVKAQTGRPSELQVLKIKEYRDAGAIAVIAYPSGWNRLKRIIDALANNEKIEVEELVLK